MFALTGPAPEAAALFAHAMRLLGGRDPRDIARTDATEALHANRTAQILCALQPLAAIEMLRNVLPDRLVLAGYSVGEVAAWGVAGILNTTDTLDLIAQRAECMSAVSCHGDGLLFVRGLSRQRIDALCERYDGAVAIVNPSDAFVIGGDGAALQAFETASRAISGTKVVRLQVEIASHTKQLAKASVLFRQMLGNTDTHLPTAAIRLLSGVDGSAVVDVATGLDKLALQISQTVQWAACLQGCVEAGATAFLELGPGSALSQMAATTYPDVPARSLEDFRTLAGVQAWLARHGSH